MEATTLFWVQGAQNHPKKFETNPLPNTALKWIIGLYRGQNGNGQENGNHVTV